MTLVGAPPYTYIWPTGDSTVTVNTLSSGSYQVTVIDNYGCSNDISVYVPGPQLIKTVYFTTICQGDSILINGAYQTTADTYYDTLVAANNCDSVVEANLSIYEVDIGTFSPIDGYIIVNDSNATYQWIDCADNSIVA